MPVGRQRGPAASRIHNTVTAFQVGPWCPLTEVRYLSAAAAQRRVAAVQGTTGVPVRGGAGPDHRWHRVSGGAACGGLGIRTRHQNAWPAQVHSGMVRRTRYRLVVLPDVCHPARAAQGTSPHISPPFVGRASRRRCDGGRGPEDGERLADTTSSRLEEVRPGTASRSACAVEGR